MLDWGIFKRIDGENFMSWKELDFRVFPGITLITGFNHDDNTSEGSGKSAILNALSWGCFGQLPKDVNIDDVIMEGQKSCTVMIELHDGIRIVRKRRPNDLYMYDSYGEPNNQIRGKDAKETQKLIEKHLGFTFETFLQSCYFAQNSTTKFLTSNEEGKAKILAEMADLNLFDAARKKAHDSARELTFLVSSNREKLGEIHKSIVILRNQINSMNELGTKLAKDRENNIYDLEKQINELANQIQMLNVATPELSEEYYAKKAELRRTLEIYRGKVLELKVQLATQAEQKMRKQSIEKQLKDLRVESESFQVQNPNGACPTCGTHTYDIPEERRVAIAAEYRSKIEEKAKELVKVGYEPTEKLEDQVAFYQKTVATIEQDLKEIDLIESSHKAQKDRLMFFIDQQGKLKQKLSKAQTEGVNDIKQRIMILEQALADQSIAYSKIKEETDDAEIKITRYTLLKDGFKEVKMYAFQDLLAELNIKTNEYLSQLFETPTSVRFSNTDGSEVSKIKTIIEINGDVRALGLFSGGQTRRIMLAVDLALADIAQSRSANPSKLLILDEYFKDLSEESMEKVYNLLQKRSGSILLIEHNSLFKNLATRQYHVEYRNGLSIEKNIAR